MKVTNIFTDPPVSPLEIHSDIRGTIVDVFYKTNIEHVSVVKTDKGGVRRGDHYHKNTTQYMLITQGSLDYWWKDLNSNDTPQVYVTKVGDLIETPPNEIHALNFKQDNMFVVFTEGLRGGQDYEKDTFRIEGTIICE